MSESMYYNLLCTRGLIPLIKTNDLTGYNCIPDISLGPGRHCDATNFSPINLPILSIGETGAGGTDAKEL